LSHRCAGFGEEKGRQTGRGEENGVDTTTGPGQMREIKSMVEAWFKGRRTRRDLFALCVLVIAPMGYAALALGRSGLWFAAFVVVAILALPLLAMFADGGWFKKR
jgi:hypothetical protein